MVRKEPGNEDVWETQDSILMIELKFFDGEEHGPILFHIYNFRKILNI